MKKERIELPPFTTVNVGDEFIINGGLFRAKDSGMTGPEPLPIAYMSGLTVFERFYDGEPSCRVYDMTHLTLKQAMGK